MTDNRTDIQGAVDILQDRIDDLTDAAIALAEVEKVILRAFIDLGLLDRAAVADCLADIAARSARPGVAEVLRAMVDSLPLSHEPDPSAGPRLRLVQPEQDAEAP